MMFYYAGLPEFCHELCVPIYLVILISWLKMLKMLVKGFYEQILK